MKPTIYPRSEHCVSRKNVDPDALKILHRLLAHGHKAYLVGGGVRDLLLGKRPKDFDIATDATPRKVKALFRNSRIIGRRFKLAHVFFRDNKIIEVSTFRDVSEPFEGPGEASEKMLARDNTYGTEETDALRRDLTINALFYDPSTFSIIDYVGGMKDLEDGVVRVIGDPEVRFQEDPVRMLRAVRHAARIDFRIEDGCWRAIATHAGLLEHAPGMRLYEELKKDLVSGHALPILLLLSESGLLHMLLPELLEHDGALLRPDTEFIAAMKRSDEMVRQGNDITSTDILTLMALFVRMQQIDAEAPENAFDTDEDVELHLQECFCRLSVPRKERERVASVLRIWRRCARGVATTAQVRKRTEFRNVETVAGMLDLPLPALSNESAPSKRRRSRRRSRHEPSGQRARRRNARFM